MIVFCGFPASGKSSFAQKHILSTGQYDYVNQDTLKSKERCVKASEDSLRNKRAVVVDNTNPDVATRALYIALARKYGVPVRCFLFTADRDLAMHNNYFRACHRALMEAAEKGQSSAITTSVTTTTSSSSDGTSVTTSTSVTNEVEVMVTKVRDELPRERLSEMVFATFANRYKEPTLEEGFTEIKRINFVPDEDIKAAWELWYC